MTHPISEKKLDVAALIERLRQLAMNHAECGSAWSEDTDEWEAADALIALTKKVDELEAALRSVPIPDRSEPTGSFYARMDVWLNGTFRTALKK